LPKYNRAERKNATPVKGMTRCRQFAVEGYYQALLKSPPDFPSSSRGRYGFALFAKHQHQNLGWLY
jgi:hypothetical protein